MVLCIPSDERQAALLESLVRLGSISNIAANYTQYRLQHAALARCEWDITRMEMAGDSHILCWVDIQLSVITSRKCMTKTLLPNNNIRKNNSFIIECFPSYNEILNGTFRSMDHISCVAFMTFRLLVNKESSGNINP